MEEVKIINEIETISQEEKNSFNALFFLKIALLSSLVVLLFYWGMPILQAISSEGQVKAAEQTKQ